MSTIKLVIADTNQPYILSLSQYLQDEYGQAFDIIHFTQPSLVEEYMSEYGDVDILLMAEDFIDKIENIGRLAKVVLFSEQQNASEQHGKIYKYQKADVIGNQLMRMLDKRNGKDITLTKRNEQGKIIGVYSPEGAAGKTTVAYQLAHQYAINSKKVLYLSFEAFSSLPIFKGKETAYGATYLLYLLKNKASNTQLKLNGMKCVDADTNVHYLPRESNVLEYKDLKREDMELLLEFLKAQSDYDAIIADFDSSINDALLGAIKQCHVFLNVAGNDSAMREKHLKFHRCISKISALLEIDLQDKLFYVFNKGCRAVYLEGVLKDSESRYVEIPYIEQSGVMNIGCFRELYELLENEGYE